ncbi:unnamed protein product [Rotaria socialis]|uniref:Uncharacterized protein n=1 Tax=Rotaria socialis TaxID=392032 RepID=A0A819A658_9BILA|nr:unnamed protein product [Rotaria socialis]
MTKASTRHTADLIRVTLFGQQDFFRPKCYSNVNKKTKIVETTSHKSLSQYGDSTDSRGHYSKNESFTTPLSKIGQSNRIKPIVVSHVSAAENGSCPTSELPCVSQGTTPSYSAIMSHYVANSEGGVKVLSQQRIQPPAYTKQTKMEALSINATVTASNFGSFAGSDAAQGDALVDRSTTGYYNSGNFAPQYVQLQLSGTYTVCEVYLNVVQTPNGVTQNQLSVGLTVASLQLVTTMNGYTSNGQWLNTSYNPCLTGVTFLRLTTTSSPSWPAWAKFLVYGY